MLQFIRPKHLALVLCASTACAEGAAESAAPHKGAKPSYVLTTTLVQNDAASSYVLFLDSLEAGEISLDSAREFPGFATVVARDNYLFVAAEEEPVVSRYEVSDQGELEDEQRISLADYGVASAGYGVNFFASAERSYLTIDARERVIWDPGEMKVVGTLNLELPDAADGFELSASYDRGLVTRGDLVFASIYSANWDSFSFAARSDIAIWNATNDEVVNITSADCPMLDAATRDDDGNVYYSSWSHSVAARYTHPDSTPDACVVRIAADSDSIDKDWTRDLSEYTEGRPVVNLQYAGDGKFMASVFHEERANKPIDADQVFGANWKLWSFDLEAGSASPVEGSTWNDGGYSLYRIGGRTYVLLTTGDNAETIGYWLDGASLKEVFRTPGGAFLGVL